VVIAFPPDPVVRAALVMLTACQGFAAQEIEGLQDTAPAPPATS
jgi:hypothetical protein